MGKQVARRRFFPGLVAIDGSSFSGLLTRVEIGHMRIGPAEYDFSKSCDSGSLLSDAYISRRKDRRHAIMDFGN